MNLRYKLLESFRKHSDRPAICTMDHNLTYSSLERLSNQIALSIHKNSIHQKLISIEIEDDFEHVVAIVGVLLSGNYYFPNKIQSMYKKTGGIKLPDFYTLSKKNENGTTISIKSIFKPDRNYSFEKHDMPDIEVREDDFCCAYLTSGSTGVPKLVRHTHRNILQDTIRQIDDNQITPNDRIDLLFSLSFSAALACIYPALLSGASLHIFNVKDNTVGALINFWAIKKITFTSMPVSLFRTLGAASFNKNKLHSLRFVSIGAEEVKKSDIDLFDLLFDHDQILQTAYASTETRTITEFRHQKTKPVNFRRGLLGKPVSGKKVMIVDERGKECLSGEKGNIFVKSEFVAGEYFGEPKLSAKVFEDGIFKTGDNGYFDEDGNLYFSGRQNSLVKIRGQFVDLEKLENFCFAIPGITNCKALTKNDDLGSAKLVLYLETGKSIDRSAIHVLITKAFTGEYAPASIVQVKAFPLNNHGKTDIPALVKFEENQTIKKSRGTPFNENELTKVILEVWQAHFNKKPIRPDKDFYNDLGGDSLQAMICLEKISAKIGKPLHEKSLLNFSTARGLANFIEYGHSQMVVKEAINTHIAGRPVLYLFCKLGRTHHYRNMATAFTSEFNLFWLNYDFIRLSENPKLFRKTIKELDQLIDGKDQNILLSQSFDGFIIQQLATKSNKINKVILLDVPNYFEYKAYHNVLFNEQIKILFRRVFTLKDPGILWHIAKKFKIRLKRNLGFTPPFKEYANRINGIVEQKYSAIANSSAIFLQSTRSANRYGFANSWKKYFTGNFSYLIFKTSHMGLLNKKSANKIANHLRNLK